MELKGQRTSCNTDFLFLYNLGLATAGLAAQFHLAYEFNSFVPLTCSGYQNKDPFPFLKYSVWDIG